MLQPKPQLVACNSEVCKTFCTGLDAKPCIQGLALIGHFNFEEIVMVGCHKYFISFLCFYMYFGYTVKLFNFVATNFRILQIHVSSRRLIFSFH